MTYKTFRIAFYILAYMGIFLFSMAQGVAPNHLTIVGRCLFALMPGFFLFMIVKFSIDMEIEDKRSKN